MSPSNSFIKSASACMALKRIFVDISELVNQDAGTGIQRVVRNILWCWLNTSIDDWRVEPVYAVNDGPYCYARRYTSEFLGILNNDDCDNPIDFAPGDLFFGLDMCLNVQISHANFYQKLRQCGVTVKFMVYDLICMSNDNYFPNYFKEKFGEWLNVVIESDGAVCISNAVKTDLQDYVNASQWLRIRPFEIGVNHLGAVTFCKQDSDLTSMSFSNLLKFLNNRTIFLMVGTLEPRKGHEQVLDAFEHNWRNGDTSVLFIVGKSGWMVERLIMRLRDHSELGNNLFWFEDVNDRDLGLLYKASTCLIAASYAEGYGLPLVEAACKKLPIIARNIPVFREVAGTHAFFFDAANYAELSNKLQEWLKLYKLDQHPKSSDLPYLTWEDSSLRLLQVLRILRS